VTATIHDDVAIGNGISHGIESGWDLLNHIVQLIFEYAMGPWVVINKDHGREIEMRKYGHEFVFDDAGR
jgi:hypothetical protein